MKRYILTFTGADRPGLIAAIATVLAEEGVDIEDVSMTQLSGNFALIMLARGGEETRLRERIGATAAELGLHWDLEPAVEEVEHMKPNLFVSAVGPNRVGIVATLATTLARHNANILEMTTRLLDRTSVPVYLVRIEAFVPEAIETLEMDLHNAAREIGVEIRVEPISIEEL